MKRVITAIALSTVVLLGLSAHAQRAAGGVRSAGGGFIGGGRSVGGVRPAGVPARIAPGGVPVRSVGRAPVSNRVIINGGFPFHSPFRCFGFPCRNQFFFRNPFFAGAGFGLPYYGYIPGFDNGYYPSSTEQQPVAAPENNNDVGVAVALQRLSDEVASVGEEQVRQMNAARASGVSLSAHQPDGLTTFVFRDGRRVVTQNYAIAGQTLWLLSEHAAKKVSLADLDLKATDQVNSANGIDLRLPETN